MVPTSYRDACTVSPTTSRPSAAPVAPRRRRAAGQSVVEFTLILPIMLFVLVGIVDFARIYTTMVAVESAAREAADYGTTLGAGKWQAGAPMDTTVAEMQRRACVAARDLPDYADSDGNADNGCLNPAFAYCLTPTVGGTCGPADPSHACEDPLRSTPCTVTVTLTHDFRLLAPIGIDFHGTRLGLPATLTFQRDSTFAMTDIGVAPGP